MPTQMPYVLMIWNNFLKKLMKTSSVFSWHKIGPEALNLILKSHPSRRRKNNSSTRTHA